MPVNTRMEPGIKRSLHSMPRLWRRTVLQFVALLAVGAAAQRAEAAENNIHMVCSPAIVNWPNNRLAHFHLNKINAALGNTHYGLFASMGHTPWFTSPSIYAYWSPEAWQGNWSRSDNYLAAIPPCVIVQPDNTTHVFAAAEDLTRIYCFPFSYNSTNDTLQHNGDAIAPYAVSGGFTWFSIAPFPDKAGNAALVYCQNHNLYYQQLKFEYNNLRNYWQWVPISGSPQYLCTEAIAEARLSICVSFNSEPTTQQDWAYKLVMATEAKDTPVSREFRMNSQREIDSTELGHPDLTFLPHKIDNTKDILAYVAPDGRPCVNAIKKEGGAEFFIKNGAGNSASWAEDFSSGSTFINDWFNLTPVSTYISHSSDAYTVSGSNIPGENTTYQPIYRYTNGMASGNVYWRNMSPYGAARKLPSVYAPSTDPNLKKLLVGIIEGPPPFPWQNMALAAYAGSLYSTQSYGFTTLQEITSKAKSFSADWSLGLVVKVEGAQSIGFAGSLNAEVGYKDIQETQSTVTDMTTITSNCQVGSNFVNDLIGSILPQGTLVFLNAGVKIYEYEVVDPNLQHIPGAMTFQQSVLSNPYLETHSYYVNSSTGRIRAGRLSTYMRTPDKRMWLATAPAYSLQSFSGQADSNPTDTINPNGLWSSSIYDSVYNNSATQSQRAYTQNASTSHGVYFDLSALAGIHAGSDVSGSISILAGIHAAGSWLWSESDSSAYQFSTGITSFAYPSPGQNQAYIGYTYHAYWLQENTGYAASIKSKLLWSGMSQDMYQENLEAYNMIADISNPWMVTYDVDSASYRDVKGNYYTVTSPTQEMIDADSN